MQSYSQDLRERVLWALGRGERPTAIGRRLEVSRVWVYGAGYRQPVLPPRCLASYIPILNLLFLCPPAALAPMLPDKLTSPAAPLSNRCRPHIST